MGLMRLFWINSSDFDSYNFLKSTGIKLKDALRNIEIKVSGNKLSRIFYFYNRNGILPQLNYVNVNSKLLLFTSIVICTFLLSFIDRYQIDSCYISFKTATGLVTATPERISKNSEMARTVKTEDGEVEVTRIDGYRVVYSNEKNAQFVNVKAELSKKNAYLIDQKKLVDNLNYMNAKSPGMETKAIMELEFNEFKIFGLNRGSIESGNTLGTFVMFPGDGVTIYFYFNNSKPEDRSFQTFDDYKKQRDRFFEEYTRYLKTCLKK